MSDTGIFWIRDDFRIENNPALSFATQNHENVIALFIYNNKNFDNQTEAQKIIKDTEYLNNRILSFDNPKATAGGRQYCRVIDKKYLFSSTDEKNKQGAVKIRFKDVMTGQEFMEQLTAVARQFTKKVVEETDDVKTNLLAVLADETEPVKSVEWVMSEFKVKAPKVFAQNKDKVENYLMELWLESKIRNCNSDFCRWRKYWSN